MGNSQAILVHALTPLLPKLQGFRKTAHSGPQPQRPARPTRRAQRGQQRSHRRPANATHRPTEAPWTRHRSPGGMQRPRPGAPGRFRSPTEAPPRSSCTRLTVVDALIPILPLHVLCPLHGFALQAYGSLLGDLLRMKACSGACQTHPRIMHARETLQDQHRSEVHASQRAETTAIAEAQRRLVAVMNEE